MDTIHLRIRILLKISVLRIGINCFYSNTSCKASYGKLASGFFFYKNPSFSRTVSTMARASLLMIPSPCAVHAKAYVFSLLST